MIYYCIYKDECSFKDCRYRQTKSKFSTYNTQKDLTVNEFICNLTNKEGTRLISDERIICDRYKKCTINCFLKTSYVTIKNFEKYFGQRRKFSLLKRFKCYEAGGHIVNLHTAGKNVGSYISIWN